MAENAEQFREWIEETIHNPFLSGIMALSVIVMPSGHTLVQHLVILHNPTPNCSLRSPTRSPTSRRMHFQRCDIDQKSWADELFVHVMIA